MSRSTMLSAGERIMSFSASLTGSWTAAGDLPSPWQWFSPGEAPVLLDDGRVLAAGGAVIRDTSVKESLLFDPTTGQWTATAPMSVDRRVHTLTKLVDGRVLAAGGMRGKLQLPFISDATAEIYDPANGTWTRTADMHVGRSLHSATLLDDGRVLVTGGMGDRAPGVMRTLYSAEIYDPDTEKWDVAAPMTEARLCHPALRLADSRVLVVGGDTHIANYQSTAQNFCELYDPVANMWTPTGSLRVPRANQQGTLLADGTVFVDGGNGPDMRFERSFHPHSQWRTERYDPATGAWTPEANMPWGRSFHRSVRLPSGRVLTIGGTDSATYDVGFPNAAVYDPIARIWAPTVGMNTGRFYHGATVLADGRVLVAGGTVRSGLADPSYGADLLTASTEIFAE